MGVWVIYYLLDLELLLSICCVAAAGTGLCLLWGCVGHLYVCHTSAVWISCVRGVVVMRVDVVRVWLEVEEESVAWWKAAIDSG